MHVVALFTGAKILKQPERPPREEWVVRCGVVRPRMYSTAASTAAPENNATERRMLAA